MSDWLNAAIGRVDPVNDRLSPVRESSLALLREAPWPSRKVEDWKYTSVKPLEQAAALPLAKELTAMAPVTSVEAIPGLDTIDLVFVNGQFMPALSSVELPSAERDTIPGASLTLLSDADAGWVQDTFSSIKPKKHLFGLVNDVLATQGVVIDIAPDAVIEKPIRLFNLANAESQFHNRLLVRVGAGAKASVIEQFVGNVKSVGTHFAEYALEPGAELNHYRFGLQTGAAVALGGDHFRLSERAQLNTTLVGFGSDLSRVDLDVIHDGEQANANINAIYLLDNSELFDLHSTVEHAVPHCTTEENVRGIVADKARAVFNGRIHIHRYAQKTLAELNNRNLLLSDRAEVDTKPELEIYADDVRCAHGATVAEIDKGALYYLQCRGIEPEQAKVMLNFAFINELVAQMPEAALADWLRPRLRARFSGMQVALNAAGR